ncbi:MAG: Chaperone protein DnaK [Chroococcopsis gigantea SAG 12.99]|jgi:molecular chaperone DnaK|nr:Hsp70 family protein [Chlorogloea purpurea SAG 13.99]MDV2999894.1 Chaperone protein DnaK [Chroococcopsis gigantea SAG 12.99]
MSYSLGIDLGTTNSVACVWRRGGLETIPMDGRATMPSAISIRPDGSVLVGQAAKKRAELAPQESVTSSKRYMGDDRTLWQIGERTYTPVDVGAIVLKELKDKAEIYLGQTVTEAVITVPAYFNNNQKRDTKLAGERAGLKVLQLLPEPTAAAISYGLDQGKDQTILVYDLGGGTFDVSVLSVKGNRFQAIAVDGDFHLGGDDFDLLLVEYLLKSLKKQTSFNLENILDIFWGRDKSPGQGTPSEILVAKQRLKEAAEKAKIELSESQRTIVTIPEILGSYIDEEITIDTYNRLILPLVDRTIIKTKSVLQAAKITEEDIDRVILVGGSSRNRLVREKIAETIKEPYISARVDEVVAQGAAIVAGSLSSPEEDITPIEFVNVTPFNLGLRASTEKDLDIFQVLIPKNSRVPTEVTQEFTTLRTNQKSVDISVFQGEEKTCSRNTFIGGFRLDGIPAAPAGQPKIAVQFRMDNSDLLLVTASCSNLRTQQILDVNLVSREEELRTSQVEADIIFLIDTSGSMSDELKGVKKSCLKFADKVISSGVDCQLGLVDFDLPFLGNKYNWEIFQPMNPKNFPRAIAKLEIGRLGGCGCHIGAMNTIPVIEGFIGAFPQNNRLKIGILISDEVGNEADAINRSIHLLKSAQVSLYVVGVAKSCHEKIAKETGGKFWNIHASRGKVDFASLLDTIAVEITNLALR